MPSWSQPHPRRQFLTAAGTLPLAALAGCATASLLGADGAIDTHTHFYDPRRAQGVPWPPPEDALLYRSMLPEEFKRLVRPHHVRGTVVVEASPWEEDNQWVLDLAAREPFILGLVGHLKPGRPEFAAQLKRFSANPLFRGIRTGLWGVPLGPDNPEFVADLARLAERDLALDVLVGPTQLSSVDRLAAAVPNLRIVIDHCANVPVDGQAPPTDWVVGLRAAARHAGVHMKVSGLVEGTGRTNQDAPVDPAFYRPVLEAVWDAFGEDRLFFGSNWPVSRRFADYGTVLNIVLAYFQSKGGSAAEKYFRTNAARFYGLS